MPSIPVIWSGVSPYLAGAAALHFSVRASLDRKADAYDGVLVVHKGLKQIKVPLTGAIPRTWIYGNHRKAVVVDLEPRLEKGGSVIEFTVSEVGNLSTEAPIAAGRRPIADFRGMLHGELVKRRA